MWLIIRKLNSIPLFPVIIIAYKSVYKMKSDLIMSTALIQIFSIYSHNTVCTLLQVFFRHFHRKYCDVTVSAFFSFVKVIHRSTVRLKRIISYKICKASLVRFHPFISLWSNKTGKKSISFGIYKI